MERDSNDYQLIDCTFCNTLSFKISDVLCKHNFELLQLTAFFLVF